MLIVDISFMSLYEGVICLESDERMTMTGQEMAWLNLALRIQEVQGSYHGS
jgi:hypothetical protein